MANKKTGCLIDISRFRVPSLGRMKLMLSNLAEQGHEIVLLNIEHVFKTPVFPVIGSEADGYTEDEFREMDIHAGACGIELIPSFQSFGHMFHILKWDEYSHLAETDARWSICISDESYDFLDRYYEVITRTFSSKLIHIGCDEVYDMFEGKSRHLLASKSRNELFYDHIMKVKEIAAKYGKEILVWGDMIERDKAVLKRIGDQAGVCYWMYDMRDLPEAYQTVNNDIYVCSGNNAWKSFFPRIRYAAANMKLMLSYFKELDAYAFMITDWGDGGHFHPASITEKLARLGRDIYDGKDAINLDLGDDKINKLVDMMDELHGGAFLNAKRHNVGSEYCTQMLFHEYVFSGTGFADQSDEQIDTLLEKIDAVRRSDGEINWCKNDLMDEELMEDLRLFIDKTYVFGKKVELHKGFRMQMPYDDLKKMTDDFVISLRKWLAVFMKRWLTSYQPMGLYFHIHFMKMLEINTFEELEKIKKKRDYKDLEKHHIYDIPEYTNIREVCNIEGLNILWKKYML